MKQRFFMRMVATALCLCLLPGIALGDTALSDAPVTHSQFEWSLALHADGFPQATSRLMDWEAFLQKLQVKGYVNSQDWLQPESRVYMDAALQVQGKDRVPFVYDGYHSYRYIVSPALAGESVHLQMHNFFDFMLKPYFFMGLNTQYLAFLLYPEATTYLRNSYYPPIAEALAGTGTRNIPYQQLHELCETLDLPVLDDPGYDRVYVYLNALLMELGAGESVTAKLGDLESYLDYLDPEQQGMSITVVGNQETYTLGETTVFEKKQAGDAIAFTLTLPDPDGYLLTLQYDWTPTLEGAALNLHLLIATEEGEEELAFSVNGVGLPVEGDVQGSGRVVCTLSGASLFQEMEPQMFDFSWSATDAQLPYALTLDIDWLHPHTALPALSMHYMADRKAVSPSVFREEAYRQEDFFSLNDSSLTEYKERFTPTLALAFAPVVMEMPAGVLNDLLEFAEETGILSALGL